MNDLELLPHEDVVRIARAVCVSAADVRNVLSGVPGAVRTAYRANLIHALADEALARMPATRRVRAVDPRDFGAVLDRLDGGRT